MYSHTVSVFCWRGNGFLITSLEFSNTIVSFRLRSSIIHCLQAYSGPGNLLVSLRNFWQHWVNPLAWLATLHKPSSARHSRNTEEVSSFGSSRESFSYFRVVQLVPGQIASPGYIYAVSYLSCLVASFVFLVVRTRQEGTQVVYTKEVLDRHRQWSGCLLDVWNINHGWIREYRLSEGVLASWQMTIINVQIANVRLTTGDRDGQWGNS